MRARVRNLRSESDIRHVSIRPKFNHHDKLPFLAGSEIELSGIQA